MYICASTGKKSGRGSMETTWSACFSNLKEATDGNVTGDSLSRSAAVLSELIELSIHEEARRSATSAHVNLVKQVMLDVIQDLQQISDSDHTSEQLLSEVLLNCLKLLRNLCAGAHDNQLTIVEFLEAVTNLLSAEKDYGQPLLRKTAIQLLGNTCVECDEGQQRVWNLCYPKLFCILLNEPNNTNCACMVLYMCIHKSAEKRQELASSGCHSKAIVTAVLRCLASSNQSEWSYLVMETLLTNVPLAQLNSLIESKDRLMMYGVLADACSDDQNKLLSGLLSVQTNLSYLCDTFVQFCTEYLSSDRDLIEQLYHGCRLPGTQIELTLQMLAVLLQVISECSSRVAYLKTLQDHSELILLVKALELLKDLSTFDGSLTSGRHRTHLREYIRENEQMKEHPLFGVKRNLMKLIGNLCYKSKRCQDKVRELGVIPVVLNQCTLDQLNPYITQWSVWTIRNLCEDNPANQAVIAQLDQRGVANPDMLDDMGGEVVIGDDGRLKVRPKKELSKQ